MRTPSQTIGPFFSRALDWPDGPFVVPEGTPGAVTIRGRVLDGAGQPVDDALIEIWQSAPDGFGRCPTNGSGEFGFVTLVPGGAARHIDVSVFARGLLRRLVTRIYFPGEDNTADAVFAELDDEARATLVAAVDGDGYRFDIRLQGERETVFFDL
jgi:protocatechuate 3,4-dioxygenase alpha subunit